MKKIDWLKLTDNLGLVLFFAFTAAMWVAVILL